MKPSLKNRLDRLGNIFKQVYLEKDNLPVNEEWQKKVMQRIHQIEPSRQKSSLFWGSGYLAWQMMPATCSLALLLGGIFLFSDPITSADMITMLYGNTQSTAIDTIFYM